MENRRVETGAALEERGLKYQTLKAQAEEKQALETRAGENGEPQGLTEENPALEVQAAKAKTVRYRTLQYEKTGGVMKITFSQPEKLNALTAEFLEEFSSLLDEIETCGAKETRGAGKKEAVRVVILTGAGKAFVAGADIALMRDMSPEEAGRYAAATTEVYRRMETMKLVFIAAINGFALGGGCELALVCDLRIASKTARLGLPEVSLGIFPGGGGTQRLPRLIGMARAKELVYTGKTITGEEAEKIGLVNYAVPPEELLTKADELAAEILKNSKTAVGLSKEAFHNGQDMSLSAAVDLEKNLFSLCFAAPDQKEGMTAFLERRPASF